MRDLIVDGVPLRDPLGEWFIDYTASKMLPELARSYSSDPEYGFHGNPSGAADEAYFGTGTETWVLNVASTDKDDHRVNLRGLSGLFQRPELLVTGAPQRTPLTSAVRAGATFNLAADNLLQARFQMNGSMAEDRIDEKTSRLTLIMENLNAFWMSSLYYSASAPVTGPTTTVPLDTMALDSSAPITDGLLRIKGPIAAGGTVTIRDRNSAFRAIRYTSTTALAATEYVVIDMATLAARLNVSDVWTLTTGTDVSNRVTTAGDGAFYLSPGLGSGFPAANWSYSLTVVAVGHTVNTTTVEVRARRSYFA